MKLHSALVTCALTSSVALAACGGSSKSSSQSASPETAVAEIKAVKVGLDKAVVQLQTGDAAAARETVADTYVDHFENVEDALDKADHELNEELEEVLSEDLRNEIKNGASAAKVKKHVEQIKADLDKAAEKLQ
jgi:hypothetical protein